MKSTHPKQDSNLFRIGVFVLCFFSILAAMKYYDAKHPAPAPTSATTQNNQIDPTVETWGNGIGSKADPNARMNWERNRLISPSLGAIPPNMRQRELDFVKKLQYNAPPSEKLDTLNFNPRGPYNVGGRTRTMVFDVNDENHIVAGGVSGGLWHTFDNGANWEKISGLDEVPNVTSIVQDPREGFTDTWYFSTGEGAGNSASGGGAYYLGNGVYKSTDNGATWVSLSVTASGTPQTFESYWDVTWRISIDPSNTGLGELYAATYGSIYRSQNGGQTWSAVLGQNSNLALYSDVSVTSTGTVFATLASEDSEGGIWRSTDGINYTEITPDNYPEVWERIVMAVNPSNENEVYFLANGHPEGQGQTCLNWRQVPEWNSLWKYTHNDNGGSWEDLSSNLFVGDYRFDDFNVQGGYDMAIAIHPTNPDIIAIAGTNVYVSTDGFTSPDNTNFIGGYKEDTDLPLFESYTNHHPDVHGLYFLPSDPNVFFTASDGGIHRTNDILADTVEWISLNNGYYTTQMYTLLIDQESSSNLIIGGLQDNAVRFVNNPDPNHPWTISFNGDGAYCAKPRNSDYYIMSIQLGKIIKARVDENTGEMIEFERIDPVYVSEEDYIFINPLALDPIDDEVLYLPAGNKLYFHQDHTFLPFTNSYDSTTFLLWTSVPDEIEEQFTAMAVTDNPAHRVYLGTNDQKVYYVDSVNYNTDVNFVDITSSLFPSDGYVSCITVDPYDGNNLFVVFSNYEVYSLFHSTDAGQSWSRVAGNLEAFTSGAGNGPSLRWLSILPSGENSEWRDYLVATSVGLFHTNTINGTATVWEKIGEPEIGNVVVETIATREQDGLILVGTHGNGTFSANLPNAPEVTGISEQDEPNAFQLSLSPNPVQNVLRIDFDLPTTQNIQIKVFDNAGRLVKKMKAPSLSQGKQQHHISVGDFAKGTYYVHLFGEGIQQTSSFVKL